MNSTKKCIEIVRPINSKKNKLNNEIILIFPPLPNAHFIFVLK